MPNTFLTKQDKPKVLTYFPTKAYGSDGDTVVVKIQGRGVFFVLKLVVCGMLKAECSL